MNLKQKSISIITITIITGAFSFLAVPSVSAATWEKIIDYGMPGYSETSNNWKRYPTPQAHNLEYRYLSHEVGDGSRTGTATWKTTVPYCGVYRVSVSFRRTENRTSDADYYITSGVGKEEHFSVDQRSVHPAFSGWVLNKDYYYLKDQEVRVHLNGTDDGQSDCADAVKWELIKETICVGGEPTVETYDNSKAEASAQVPIRILLTMPPSR